MKSYCKGEEYEKNSVNDDRWVKYVLFDLLSYLKWVFEQLVHDIGRE